MEIKKSLNPLYKGGNIKKSCSQTIHIKSFFTALCFKIKFCVFLKNDFPFLDKKMDIYFCPFFCQDPISFFEKNVIIQFAALSTKICLDKFFITLLSSRTCSAPTSPSIFLIILMQKSYFGWSESKHSGFR